MESQPRDSHPEEHGFNIPKQDWSIGDQADMYLTLALKKCGDNETVIYDGVQTAVELRTHYDKDLEIALKAVPLDERDMR